MNRNLLSEPGAPPAAGSRPLRLLGLVFLALLLTGTGCSILPGNPPPTFIPEEYLPTLVELTAQALVDQGLVTPPPPPTLSPSELTATAAPTSTATPTVQPSSSPTPTLDVVLGTAAPPALPDPLPQAEIQIISPGRLSRVRSPFNLHLFLAPPQSDREETLSYRIALYGEDARILHQEDLPRQEGGNPGSHLVKFIPFEIQGSAETARLEISSRDDYGRITALVSTELVLLIEGKAEIKAIQNLYASLVIQQPIPSTLIQGDVLVVQGVTRYAPDDQLIVELVNRDGSQVGSGLVPVADQDLGFGYRAFAGEIPFQVDRSSWIRVQLIARDGKFSGIQHLSSVEVLVSP